ncbi:MAG: hypothetical protein JKY86_14515, partial [Gammaproteobacteria bacterium]|nr:hypothetical protein [Gammaproteobacteria bacterium]
EVLQEAIQPVSEIEAIVDTKDSFDIDGNPITIQNPAKYDPVSGVLARIDGAQVVLDGATQDTLDLVALRV